MMQYLERRKFLKDASLGFGAMAFSALASRASQATPLAHYASKAKHVILCFMDGGPSHVDTFDPKPELTRQEGKADELDPAAGHENMPKPNPWAVLDRVSGDAPHHP